MDLIQYDIKFQVIKASQVSNIKELHKFHEKESKINIRTSHIEECKNLEIPPH